MMLRWRRGAQLGGGPGPKLSCSVPGTVLYKESYGQRCTVERQARDAARPRATAEITSHVNEACQ